MQILDSLIDGPLELKNKREGNELIGMIVRYLRTGEEPNPRTDTQKMALSMVYPVLKKSRARVIAGSKGGSKKASKSTSKTANKTLSKPSSKRVSDIYIPPSSIPKEDEGSGEKEEIPYSVIVDYLNNRVGTSYKASSKKTRSLIHARFQDGFTLNDFKAVIDKMATEWENDQRMCVYLRPETLFGTKFESYLNRFCNPKAKENRYAEYE